MKPNQNILKINDKHSISILKTEDGYEIAHLENGKISEEFINDVIKLDDDYYLADKVQELMADIVHSELSDWSPTLEVEGQVLIETFTYNIWIACCYNRGEISYSCSTINREEDDDEVLDKNVVERKTWKGLLNYLKRFDK